MAFEIPGVTQTFEASGDLSAAQFKFVKVDTNGRIAVCAAATDQPIGILQDKPNALGKVGTVMLNGVSKVQADAALALGDKVGTSADGQAAPYAFGTDTTKFIVGTVLKAAGAAGERATIAFDCLSPARGA